MHWAIIRRQPTITRRPCWRTQVTKQARRPAPSSSCPSTRRSWRCLLMPTWTCPCTPTPWTRRSAPCSRWADAGLLRDHDTSAFSSLVPSPHTNSPAAHSLFPRPAHALHTGPGDQSLAQGGPKAGLLPCVGHSGVVRKTGEATFTRLAS